MFLENPKFARKLRISDFVVVETNDAEADAMLHLAFR
jgi:hypothetical protein